MTETILKPKKAAVGLQFKPGETLACPRCGHATKLTGWVVAHWDEQISWVCPSCPDRTQVSMLSGEVTSILPVNPENY